MITQNMASFGMTTQKMASLRIKTQNIACFTTRNKRLQILYKDDDSKDKKKPKSDKTDLPNSSPRNFFGRLIRRQQLTSLQLLQLPPLLLVSFLKGNPGMLSIVVDSFLPTTSPNRRPPPPPSTTPPPPAAGPIACLCCATASNTVSDWRPSWNRSS